MCIVIILIIGQIIAFGADFFVVHLEDVRGQALRPGRFIITQHAHIWFCVCVQVPFQAPIVAARPGTIATDESFVAFLLGRFISRLLRFDIALIYLLLHRHLLLIGIHMIVAGWLWALVRCIRRYVKRGGRRLLLMIEVRAIVGASGVAIIRAFLIIRGSRLLLLRQGALGASNIIG